MRILFDTHTLIWFLSDSPHLTPQARGLLSREGVEIFFSPISIEEIAIKHSLKPEVMPCEPSEVLATLWPLCYDSRRERRIPHHQASWSLSTPVERGRAVPVGLWRAPFRRARIAANLAR